MTGTSLKLWKMFSNINCAKNVLANKLVQPAHQPLAGVKQSVEKKSNLPEKPKRPPTAFLSFFQSNLKLIAEKNPEATHRERVNLASKQWKESDDSVRSPYQENFKKQWGVYLEEKKSYDLKLTPEMKMEILLAKETAKEAALKRKIKREQRERGKPIKPATPWSAFLRSKSNEKGDKSLVDWVKEASLEWNKLDKKIKEKDQQEFLIALKKYQEDLDKWEKEMIGLGLTHLVRLKAQLKPKKEKENKAADSDSK